MVKRLSVLCVCLLLPRIVTAGPMVTWQSIGEISSSLYGGIYRPDRVPPVGTPYELRMSFDPSSMTPTRFSPPGSNCFQVDVTGSFTLGGFTWGMGGKGFTHATLPGSNCTPGYPDTQFLMGSVVDPPGNPWPALDQSFMELFYTDLLVRDAFPSVPTQSGTGMIQIRDSGEVVSVHAPLNFHALDPEQPAPVPEPGTMMLFGLGLAAAARKVRRDRARSIT